MTSHKSKGHSVLTYDIVARNATFPGLPDVGSCQGGDREASTSAVRGAGARRVVSLSISVPLIPPP